MAKDITGLLSGVLTEENLDSLSKQAGVSPDQVKSVLGNALPSLLGGALGFLLEWGLYDIVTNRIMTGLMGNLISVLPFESFSMPVLAVYLGVGIIVGAFGSSIAIRNYLRV